MSHQHDGRGVTGEEFQKILQERIQERKTNAVVRRQHDLQRIRDMKSSSGIDPLEQFPKELWEAILEPLGPKDLGSALEVHPLFQEMLDSNRIRDIHFPQILNFKVPPFWERDLGRQYGGEQHPLLAGERIEPKPMAEFIRLREVSKSLRNSIDQWHEDNIISNLYSEEEAKLPSFTCEFPADIETIEFGDPNSDEENEPNSLDGILANFSGDGNKARRYFLRSLKVKLCDEDGESFSLFEDFLNFKKKVLKLLGLIGDQIWHFEYEISYMCHFEVRRRVHITQIYLALVEYAKLMPNLKWLVLRNESEGSNVYAQSIIRISSKKNPFPRLEHLVRASVFSNSEYYNNIFEMLSSVLRANDHVKVLNVVPGNDWKKNKYFFKEYLSPLLESLSLALEMFSVNHITKDLRGFGHLQPVLNLKWPLKRLHLTWDTFNSTIKCIFDSLENFQTMEYLTLGLADVSLEDKDNIPFLKLPNLTHFKVEVKYNYDQFELRHFPATNFFFSLQFLLHARKLKKVEWKLELWEYTIRRLRRFLVRRELNEKGINFRAGCRDLRSCNIWDIFPNLEDVEVEFKYNSNEGKATKCHRGDRI